MYGFYFLRKGVLNTGIKIMAELLKVAVLKIWSIW